MTSPMSTGLRSTASGIAALAAIVAIAGCATPPQMRPLAEGTGPIASNGFSVTPPKGTGWFVQEHPDAVAFFKRLPPDEFAPAGGKPITVARTFFVLVALMQPTAADLSSAQALRHEVERLVSAEEPPVRRVIDYSVTPYAAQGTDCVRYVVRYQERDRPFAPGAVLDMPGGGFMCRHPSASGRAVHATFSERRLNGAPERAGENHLAEAEAVIGSVTFGPLRGR
jgi:hypothetical protein